MTQTRGALILKLAREQEAKKWKISETSNCSDSKIHKHTDESVSSCDENSLTSNNTTNAPHANDNLDIAADIYPLHDNSQGA